MRRLATALACAAAFVALAAASADAVSIVQHPLPGGARLLSPDVLLGVAGGVVSAATAQGPAFEMINTGGAVSLTAGPAGPTAIRMTRGPNGNLWFLSTVLVKEPGGEELPYAALFEVTTAGIVQRARYASTGDAPVALAGGSDGALWLANDGGGYSIDRFLPGGQIVRHPTSGPPIAIAGGPDGALWFTDAGPCPGYGGPCIGRIATTGELSYYPLPWPSGPFGITAGADGALWFAEWQASAIGRITTSGAIQQYKLPNPAGSAPGAGGPTPVGVAPGPAGSIWFTDPGDDAVGQITAAGTVSEYPIPPLAGGERVNPAFAEAVPQGIAAGPEGLLWVTEANAKTIASVDPNGQPRSVAARRGRAAAHRRSRRRRALR
ncbi:MAG: putative hydrolase [Solirubrobacterales bacterium]|nr:putative hydrolase [Solirubrobacterales bacterium]